MQSSYYNVTWYLKTLACSADTWVFWIRLLLFHTSLTLNQSQVPYTVMLSIDIIIIDNFVTIDNHISFCSLPQLCNLQLQHNMISTLGKSLTSLRKLKVLRIDCNQLIRLDVREIAGCSSLTSLNISSNRLDNIGVSQVNCLITVAYC